MSDVAFDFAPLFLVEAAPPDFKIFPLEITDDADSVAVNVYAARLLNFPHYFLKDVLWVLVGDGGFIELRNGVLDRPDARKPCLEGALMFFKLMR